MATMVGGWGALAETPRYINTSQIVLSYQTDPGVPIEQAKVWISRDLRRTWQPVSKVFSTPGSIRFNTQTDGRYDVYMVLVNAAGRSAADPEPGARSHGVIIVDTTPPLLQVHRAQPVDNAASQRQLQLDVTLVEEHLHEHGVRLFYRTDGGQDWRDGGPVRIDEGRGQWPIPEKLSAPFEILLVTADRAGNRALSEPFHVAARQAVPEPTQPAVSTKPADKQFASPTVPEVTEPAESVEPANPERLTRLRARVADRLSRNELADAEALLSVALSETPAQPDLLSDLGSVMYRLERFEAAAERYEAALESSPDHRSALEGLALVAQTERRYPDARTHLRRLLELADDSPLTWLRYGDVENRLGNRGAARRAWQRSLELAPDRILRQRAQQRLDQFPAPEEAAIASHAQFSKKANGEEATTSRDSSADRPLRGRTVSETTRSG